MEALFYPFSWIESMEKLLLKLILLLSKNKIRQNILGPNAGQASWAGLYGLLSVLNWQKWWPPQGLEPPNVLYSTLRWIEKDNCLVSGFSQIPATSPSALCTLHSSSFSSSQKCVQGEEPLQCLLCKKVGLNISHSSPKITHPWKEKNPERQQCTFSFEDKTFKSFIQGTTLKPTISLATLFLRTHGVWKSQKKSHTTLRAKRTMFTFWVDKS